MKGEIRPDTPDYFGQLIRFGQNALRLVATLGLGALIVLVAGMIALMTAFAGLMLAATALVMRYLAPRQPQPVPAKASKGEPVTLNARRTPRGWTVEP